MVRTFSQEAGMCLRMQAVSQKRQTASTMYKCLKKHTYQRTHFWKADNCRRLSLHTYKISQEKGKCLRKGNGSQKMGKHLHRSLCIRKHETGLIKENRTKGKCLNRRASFSEKANHRTKHKLHRQTRKRVNKTTLPKVSSSKKVKPGVLQAVSFGGVMWQRDDQLQARRLHNSSLAVRAAIKISDAATLTGRGLLSTPVVG